MLQWKYKWGGINVKEVYIVKMFDGESSYILGVFLSKDKANEYANTYEKEQEELYGYVYDTCHVSRYEVIE